MFLLMKLVLATGNRTGLGGWCCLYKPKFTLVLIRYMCSYEGVLRASWFFFGGVHIWQLRLSLGKSGLRVLHVTLIVISENVKIGILKIFVVLGKIIA